MKNNRILQIVGIIALYLALKYFIPYGRQALYPINLLVTFLHEFGHAVGALITGGEVVGLEVNPDGSGLCTTRGGNRAITLMGGYIGSAIFGNLILYIGLKKRNWTRYLWLVMSIILVAASIYWFSDVTNLLILVAFGIASYFLSRNQDLAENLSIFVGLASIIHIIEDFNVGPSSDLAAYAEVIPIFPTEVWMYIWLIIVIILTILNLRFILKNSSHNNDTFIGS